MELRMNFWTIVYRNFRRHPDWTNENHLDAIYDAGYRLDRATEGTVRRWLDDERRDTEPPVRQA